MDFFYDIKKKLETLTEGKKAKPDFLDVDKDGDKEEPMKKAFKDKIKEAEEELDERSTGDYSAKKARAGKDIGKPGKAFAKIAKSAGERYGSKERGEKVAGAVLAKLRKAHPTEDLTHGLEEEETDEGNAFTAKLKSTPKGGKFKLGDKTFTDTSSIEEKKEISKKHKGTAFDPEHAKTMFAPEKGKTKTGHSVQDTGYSKRYTKTLADEPETDDDDGAPKKKGRKAVGAGKGKKIGAKHSGTSKLHRKAAIAECNPEEYDMEGSAAKDDIHTIVRHARSLEKLLRNDENLPEWVQSKLAKIEGMMVSIDDYMASQHERHYEKETGEEGVVAEKAVSRAQQKFMGMVHAAQKGAKPASKEVAKVAKEMPKKAAKDFAATKHKGLPQHVKSKKEEVEETTTSGSVATATEAPKSKKGGMVFGKGVYEGMNDKVEQLISEGINFSVNVGTGPDGQPHKTINVSAEGDDAEALAKLLNLAGIGGQQEQVEEVDDNQPDWPTDDEVTGNDDPHLQRWAGGLNKPKETGQTTIPVVNRDPRRGSFGPAEHAVDIKETTDLGMNLYKELQSYKTKK